jgi:hypothetical protein
MSGDYSRVRFDPKKDFNGMLQQQGRVHLESDANELARIIDRRFRAQTSDTLGRCVVPRQTPAGFQIGLAGGALVIGQGRIYVDGLLAENHGKGAPLFDGCLAEEFGAAIGYDEQPYFPNAAQLAPLPQTPGPHLAYLVVYERELTHVERPDLIEKAIAQDTVTALQTIWQVRLLADIGQNTTCGTPDEQFPAWQALTRPSGGRLTTSVVDVPADTDPCVIAPGGSGYRGLENQLYRVEIHRGGPIGTATFKWSRENASVATAVIATQGGRLTVASLGRDAVLRFSPGDWIEITDDWRELSGTPPPMRKVLDVDLQAQVIVIDPLDAADFPADAQGKVDPARHTRIRRWDQQGDELDASGGVIPVPAAGTPVLLEHGVQVTFDLEAPGELKGADHWTFAASVADASVEKLDKAVPRGIHRHYARLAVLTFPGTITDCRTLWPPLSQPAPEPEDKAIHVRRVLVADERLRNDTNVPGPILARSGIRIDFDGPLDPRTIRGKPTCFVTLSLPYPLNDIDIRMWNPVPGLLGAQPLVLAGNAEAREASILWSPSDPVARWLQGPLLDLVRARQYEPRLLTRLTLKGNFIWTADAVQNPEKPITYLDGDAFGIPQGDILDLRLPSGDGRKGGDFEMWFWLVPG